MEDTTESDPREVEAASFNLNYVQVRIFFLKKMFFYFAGKWQYLFRFFRWTATSAAL